MLRLFFPELQYFLFDTSKLTQTTTRIIRPGNKKELRGFLT